MKSPQHKRILKTLELFRWPKITSFSQYSSNIDAVYTLESFLGFKNYVAIDLTLDCPELTIVLPSSPPPQLTTTTTTLRPQPSTAKVTPTTGHYDTTATVTMRQRLHNDSGSGDLNGMLNENLTFLCAAEISQIYFLQIIRRFKLADSKQIHMANGSQKTPSCAFNLTSSFPAPFESG